MNGWPTTTVTILRPSSAPDGWDNDAATNESVAASGIPASIIEQYRNVRRRSTKDPRLAREITGRVGAGTGVRRDDRLRDESNGRVYAVVTVRQPENPVFVNDEILELTRTDQTDP